MEDTELTEKNVLGGPLLACSYAPLTGFFRDGWCATHSETATNPSMPAYGLKTKRTPLPCGKPGRKTDGLGNNYRSLSISDGK